ncbi:MAG: ATPase domain-containing protein [Candidatus Methanofastidiosia archaeon]|jgi:KaiC/GvpD/RAD55 family RecA-like ATPase
MDEKYYSEKWVKFGIEGLNKLFHAAEGEPENECGIPRGSSVILSGDMGTGKTTFLMQFLKHGIEKGEKGIFVSLEESPYNLLRDYCHWEFGKDRKLIDVLGDGSLTIVDATSFIQETDLDKQIKRVIEQYYFKKTKNKQKNLYIMEKYNNIIKSNGIYSLESEESLSRIPIKLRQKIIDLISEDRVSKREKFRVCIDSLTAFLSYGIVQPAGSEQEAKHTSFGEEIRKTIVELRANLESRNVTTLLTVEAMPLETVETSFTTAWRNIENFVARGVIQLGYHSYEKGDLVRYLRILKMRGVGHSTTKHAFEITGKKVKWIGELI